MAQLRSTTITGDLILNGSRMYNYVVEEGNSNGWYYRKWANGLKEAWCAYTVSAKPATAWGSTYYVAVSAKAFPTSFFQGIPHVYGLAASASGNGWITTASTTAANTGSIYIISPVKETSNLSFEIDLYAAGN